jgi:hypothetical protein
MPEKIDFSSILYNWKAPFLSREEAAKASGGTISAKTLANLDSHGEGPPGRIMIGGKIAYPTAGYAEWLSQRSKPVKTA